jgi:hypothetical protein
MAVAFREKGIGGPAEHLGEPEGDAVRKALRLMVDAKIDERCGHVGLL